MIRQPARLEISPNCFIEKDFDSDYLGDAQENAREWAINCLKDIGITAAITVRHAHRYECRTRPDVSLVLETKSKQYWLSFPIPTLF